MRPSAADQSDSITVEAMDDPSDDPTRCAHIDCGPKQCTLTQSSRPQTSHTTTATNGGKLGLPPIEGESMQIDVSVVFLPSSAKLQRLSDPHAERHQRYLLDD